MAPAVNHLMAFHTLADWWLVCNVDNKLITRTIALDISKASDKV